MTLKLPIINKRTNKHAKTLNTTEGIDLRITDLQYPHALNQDSFLNKIILNIILIVSIETITHPTSLREPENLITYHDIGKINIFGVNTINVYDLLKYKKLVLTVDTIKKLEEVYA